MTDPATLNRTFRTAVTVGATGMLTGALEWIAAHAQHPIVIARHASASVERRALATATPLDLDWRCGQAFVETILSQVDPDRVDLLLLWIHSTGADALRVLLDQFAHRDCLIVHVLSSASGDSHVYRKALHRGIAAGLQCRYRTLKLGAKRHGVGWRWLTAEEISEGAIKAMRSGQDIVVGEVP